MEGRGEYAELLQLCQKAPKQLTHPSPEEFISEIQTSGLTYDELKALGWPKAVVGVLRQGRPDLIGKTVRVSSRRAPGEHVPKGLDSLQVKTIRQLASRIVSQTHANAAWEAATPRPIYLGVVLNGSPWLAFRDREAEQFATVIVVEMAVGDETKPPESAQ